MEPTLITPTPPSPQAPVAEQVTQNPENTVPKTAYPWARHILLIVLVLLAIVIILSLIYLNGKSIYQYGV
jgi:hypothetical protein